MNKYLNSIDIVFIINNTLLIYFIYGIIGDNVKELIAKSHKINISDGSLKKLFTLIVSIINAMFWYHLKYSQPNIIITSIITSCVCYDYIIKYVFKFINSKFND